MINVLKNRTRLCALTTSVFFFLQGMDVSMGASAGVGDSLISNPFVVSAGEGFPSYRCEVGTFGQIDRGPIYCDDGEFHKMKRGSITVPVYGSAAVTAIGKIESLPASADLQDDDIDNTFHKIKETTVELDAVLLKSKGLSYSDELVTFENGIFTHKFSDSDELVGFGSAVYSVLDAKVDLKRSNIRGFIVGLNAESEGIIVMRGGEVRRSFLGAEASDASFVVLDKVAINVDGIGLYSDGSGINMVSGSLVFPEEGIGGISTNYGSITLKNVNIQIKKAGNVEVDSVQDSDNDGPKSVGFLLHEGFVSFDDVTFNDSDAAVLYILGGLDNVVRQSVEYASVLSVEDVSSVEVADVSLEDLLRPEYVVRNNNFITPYRKGQPADNNAFASAVSTMSAVLNEIYDDKGAFQATRAFKVSASIKSSNITLNGKESYGIYFKGRERDEEKLLSSSGANEAARVVLLEDTKLNVPDGLAIYGDEGSKSYIILGKKSRLSGNLSLKAEPNSIMSVFAHDSTILGGVVTDEHANTELFLSGNSSWHLIKSKDKGWKCSEADNYIDSCISAISLVDSSIKFVSSQSDQAHAGGYQTLRIGDESTLSYGVYNSLGGSAIYLNAHVISDDSGHTQMVSDKLLIYGFVSGETTVHVNDVVRRGGNSNTVRLEETQNKSHSVSMIQVYGLAREDSFQLSSPYVTMQGSPYQYTLRAYKMENSEKTFEGDLESDDTAEWWDFRLESKVQDGDTSTYLLYIPGSPINGVEEVAYTVVDGDDDLSKPSVLGRSEIAEDLIGDLSLVVVPSTLPERSASVASAELERSETEDEVSVILNPSSVETSIPPTVSGNSAGPVRGGQSAPVARSESDGGVTVVLSPSSVETSTPPAVSDNSAGPVGGEQSASVARSESDGGVTVVLSPSSVETSTPPAVSDNSAGPVGGEQSASVARSESDGGVTVVLSPSSVETSTPPAVSDNSAGPVGGEQSASVARSEESAATPYTVFTALQGTTESRPVGRILLSTPVKSTVVSTESRDPAPIISAAASPQPSVMQSIVTSKPSASVDSAGKESVSSQCNDRGRNGAETLQNSYLCNDGQTHTVTDLTLKASGALQHPMHAKSQNTIIKLEGATIMGAADSENNVDLTKLQLVSTVFAEDGAEVVLDKKSTVKNSSIGLEAQKGGKVKMIDGTVNARYVGVLAGSGSSVNLSNTKINVTGDLAIAGLASNAGEATMNTGVINLTSGVAVRSESEGNVKLDNVKITAKKGQQDQPDSAETFGRAAFLVSDRGSVEFTNGYVSTDANGLWMRDSNGSVENGASDTGLSRRKRSSDVRSSLNRANIEFSKIEVEGDKSYGIYFDGAGQKEGNQQNRSKVLEDTVAKLSGTGSPVDKVSVVKRSTVSQQEKTPIGITGAVSLKKTRFEVANGVAIYGNNSGGQISLEKDTILSGDLLLSAENNSYISVSVDDSIIEGWARIDKSSYAKLDLINKSEWILKRSVKRNFATTDSGCIDSCVSSIRLVNSTIDFVPSESEDLYQTLHIGIGNGKVYEAHGDVAIFLNARLNPRDPSDQQVTDRLVIHGDVEGKTRLHIRGVPDIVGEGKDNNQIAHSVSIVQVYGQAEKDSFQLDGNYVALANSPYKYVLRSYGPQLTAKQEHIEQKFIKDGGAFWNFRLENQYVKPSVPTDGLVLDERVDGFVLPERVVRSVVPQVPTYLLLPNSLFHVGLMDIGDQNKQL
ncbi:autotransporter outer membrane beta-barrel domain-containing protein, partial [Bartonella henselae]